MAKNLVRPLIIFILKYHKKVKLALTNKWIVKLLQNQRTWNIRNIWYNCKMLIAVGGIKGIISKWWLAL